MTTLRILLLVFLFTFLLVPLGTWNYFSVSNYNFEKEELKEKMKYGAHAHEIYGDCTGMTTIIPIAFSLYCALFLFWSLALTIAHKSISHTAMVVQATLIGALGFLPAVVYCWAIFSIREL